MGQMCQQEATGICADPIRLAWYTLCPRGTFSSGFVKEKNWFVSTNSKVLVLEGEFLNCFS